MGKALLLSLLLIAGFGMGGCYRHREAVADSAASIVELSVAIEYRPDLAPQLAPSIRTAAQAIIQAQGATYTPTLAPPALEHRP